MFVRKDNFHASSFSLFGEPDHIGDIQRPSKISEATRLKVNTDKINTYLQGVLLWQPEMRIENFLNPLSTFFPPFFKLRNLVHILRNLREEIDINSNAAGKCWHFKKHVEYEGKGPKGRNFPWNRQQQLAVRSLFYYFCQKHHSDSFWFKFF